MVLQISTDTRCWLYKNNKVIAKLDPGVVSSIPLIKGKNCFRFVSVKYAFLSIGKEYIVPDNCSDTIFIDSIRLLRLEKNFPKIIIATITLFIFVVIMCICLVGNRPLHDIKIYKERSDSIQEAQKETVKYFKTDDTGEIKNQKGSVVSIIENEHKEITYYKKTIPADYILVPRGIFTKEEYNDKLDREYNVIVSVDSFYICKSELTQGEYARVMGTLKERNYRYDVNTEYPTKYRSFKDKNLPVIGSYLDFVCYCNKRSIEEGYDGFYTISGSTVTYNPKGNGYRLLLEDEWTFAALGGKDTPRYKYIGGNKLTEIAWYGGNSGNKPHQVCMKKPNELGIYDMAGNVWELLQSTYKGKYHYIAGHDFLHWPYSGREFNEKAINYSTDVEALFGTRIALIVK